MATLPALVTAIAEVDGRDRATIDHFARTIREAGYIPTTKRGVGASKMTSREAANLLIALNGAETAKEAPLAIDRFRSLELMWSPSFVGLCKEYPPPVKDISEIKTFGEALEHFIDSAPELLAFIYVNYAKSYKGPFSSSLNLEIYGFNITFGRYMGKFELYHSTGGERVVDFEAVYTKDIDRLAKGFYGPEGFDRKITVKIGLRTIIAVWNALHPDSEIADVSGGSSAIAAGGVIAGGEG